MTLEQLEVLVKQLQEKIEAQDKLLKIHEQDLARFYADMQSVNRRIGQASKK